VDHASLQSVGDVASLFKELTKEKVTSIAAVGVELDPRTASCVLACTQAFPPQTAENDQERVAQIIKSHGEKIIKDQLFQLPEIHAEAAAQGHTLESSDQIVLPTVLRQYLGLGILWGAEMAKVS
jgi:hypothetical protein